MVTMAQESVVQWLRTGMGVPQRPSGQQTMTEILMQGQTGGHQGDSTQVAWFFRMPRPRPTHDRGRQPQGLQGSGPATAPIGHTHADPAWARGGRGPHHTYGLLCGS